VDDLVPRISRRGEPGDVHVKRGIRKRPRGNVLLNPVDPASLGDPADHVIILDERGQLGVARRPTTCLGEAVRQALARQREHSCIRGGGHRQATWLVLVMVGPRRRAMDLASTSAVIPPRSPAISANVGGSRMLVANIAATRAVRASTPIRS